MTRALPFVLLVACGLSLPRPPDAGADAGASPDAGTEVDAGADAGGAQPDPLVLARPFGLVVPAGYTGATPVPLVVLLHGYTATAASQDAYFRLSQLAQERTFLLALPNGTVDERGQQFWNATDACCGFGKTVDDVAYLTAVIDDVKARYAVDPKRVFLVGHSNGGFMSHRLACDRASRIAGIVSLAGAAWADPSRCSPSEPVSVLQVHGSLDAIIRYDGGSVGIGAPPYPAAVDTVGAWAVKNGCTGAALAPVAGNLDLVGDLPLAETERAAFGGCPPGGAAELWTIRGGGHLPAFNASWAPALYDWLLAHPKP
jgi:polyhydroxybutyrate depolymerase